MLIHNRPHLHRLPVLLAAGVLAIGGLVGCELSIDWDPGAGDAPGAPAQRRDEVVESRVTRVIDGDTIAVEPVPGVLDPADGDADEHIVRLLGIDTPEMNYHSGEKPECGAEEATDHLEQILPQGSAVSLTFDPVSDSVDCYGRSLAYVASDDVDDVALMMASDGHASAWYPSGEPEPERFGAYESAFKQADQQSLGSWSSCAGLGW